MNKCARCKKNCEGLICQTCKSELLPYYEKTKDWELALDMELANQRVARYHSESESNDYF